MFLQLLFLTVYADLFGELKESSYITVYMEKLKDILAWIITFIIFGWAIYALLWVIGLPGNNKKCKK